MQVAAAAVVLGVRQQQQVELAVVERVELKQEHHLLPEQQTLAQAAAAVALLKMEHQVDQVL
jgi:hypothetical protein